MAWGEPRVFPRAIVHIDGDSFFASCEVAKNPKLRGKPVITGSERGIVSSMTYEAKRAGVKRGSHLADARKACPDAIILPSDYETYCLFSERMYEIVRRYTPTVEEYSIDECFADITGLRRLHHMSYPKIAAAIQKDLERELGMTFSIGLSATKVLAKIGSKWKKPDGLTVISQRDVRLFLEKTPVEKLWGIGHNTAEYLNKFHIYNAWQFAQKSEAWVRATLSKPYIEIWQELNGNVVYELDSVGRKTYTSIAKTKTFTPPSKDPTCIYSQLSKNIENACIKLRRWNLVTSEISFFLKTQEFRYHTYEVKLSFPTSVPQDILKIVGKHFPQIFQKGVLYRATGVAMMKLQTGEAAQLDLFGAVEASDALKQVFLSVDEITERYGKHAVFLGSSFAAMTQHQNPQREGRVGTGHSHSLRYKPPERHTNLFKGETARRRLGIPMLGEVA